jgi:ADP-ribose pyrophosphatase YjhB (NUDIX family)
MKEETGLDVAVGAMIEVFERIERHEGVVQAHFVVVDYLCSCVGGTLCAGDDAADVAWVGGDELDDYGVCEPAARVIRTGLGLALQSRS